MTSPENNQSTLRTALFSAAVSVVVTFLILIVFGAVDFDNNAVNNNQTAAVGQATPSASTTSSQTAKVVEEASPSVVSIIVTEDVPVVERYFQEGPFGIPRPQQRQEGTRRQQVAGGSGFFVSDDGLLVTNKHVVSNTSASYSAVTSDGETHELEVVGRDPFLDVAVLETVDGDDYPALSFGDSDELMPGETVIAIGNALGQFQNSVSVGVVSGLSRSVVAGGPMGQSEQLEQVIQTDAAVNPGNSGGPLLNLSGEVIGVNVAIAQASENISFALPSNLVQEVVSSVEEHGEIVRPFLGVRYISITEEVAEMRDLPVDRGALVIANERGEAITPGSAADEAEIQEGDILLSLGGTEITSDTDLGSIIREHDVGDTISMTILRDGERQQVEVTLQQAPESIQ